MCYISLLKLFQETGISFSFEERPTGRTDNYKIWRDGNYAIDMSDIAIIEKLEYMHNNPVRAGIVAKGEDYLYSSATDYAGIKGLVELEII